jgi:D-amino-acid dehydrogenase
MEEKGCLMLYKSEHTEKHEIELAKEAAELNIETQIFSAKEVQQMEPDVELNVRGGILYPIDCHLHPGDLMATIKKYLDDNGVEFKLNTTITGFEKNAGVITKIVTDKGDVTGNEYVLATGSWLPLVTKELGIEILLQAGKGYSMTFENIPKNIKYPAILVDDRVAMTPMGPDLRMGGTMEISGIGSPTLMKRVNSIFSAAKSYYPNLPVEFPKPEKIWSGLRPLSPDGLPYIGRHSGYKNLVIAGGHAMLGISLAAATGKLIEEIIAHKKTSIDTSAFDVER